MADTARVVPRIVLFAACFILSLVHAETLDRRCLQGDCVSLEVDKGTVLAHRTGAWPATRKVGSLWARARGTIPATEAPIMAATATHGWSAVIAAYLPTDFDAEGPELKLYLSDSSNRNRVVHPMYNFLNSFNIGKLLGTNEEFVQVSTTGVHAYVVRTIVIRLGDSRRPKS